MEDLMKTKEQLIGELNELRKSIDDVKKNAQERKLPKHENQWWNNNLDEITFMSVMQNIINVFPYYVIIIDENHNILLANETTLNVLGKSIEDIAGHYCPNIIHGIDEVFPGCPLEEALKKDKCIEKDLLDPFYKTWVSSAIYPMNFKTPDGKKIFFHIARDITERKNAEETIHRQNDLLKNLIESLTQPFFVIDVNDYTIIMANSASKFGTLTKKSKCFKLTHHKNKPCIDTKNKCPIEIIKKTKKPVVVEHEHYISNVGVRYFEVHGYPLFDKDGKLIQIIEYTLDITKRKQAEKKLKVIKKKLEIKTKNLEEYNIALKVLLDHQKDEKKNMNRNILENIKTLVNPYLEKLKDTLLTESQTTLLNILESNLTKIIRPFSTLLMSESIKFSPSEVRVADMVKEGKTAKEIAQIMYISENTVKAYYTNIRSKLKIKNQKINLRTYLQSLEELAWYKKL